MEVQNRLPELLNCREEKPALFELELTKGSLDMCVLNQCVLDSIFCVTIKAARLYEI
jgi:hypothetical protein